MSEYRSLRPLLPSPALDVQENYTANHVTSHSLFTPRVSFDTFEKPTTDIISFSLIKKHKDYEYTKRSRTFLCGLDQNDYSWYALEWLLDELVDDGDEVVCLRVVEKDATIAQPPSKEQGQYRDEAEKILRQVQEKNSENKAVNLILEFAVGKVPEVIENMVSSAKVRQIRGES